MAVKRLGKGLGALIPEMSTDDGDSESLQRLRDIDVSRIKPNRFQPRENFDPQALEELKESIQENGVIQPISVREIDAGFELIAGERRLRAVQALGVDTIPAYIMSVQSDEEMMEFALIENIQREDLNPIDEANGYQALMDMCNLTQEEVAKKVSKDRSTITNALRLLKLPDAIQQSLVAGEITSGHARSFLSLPDKAEQLEIWKKTVKKGLSVRAVENMVKGRKPGDRKSSQQNQMPAVDPFIRDSEDRLRTILGTRVRIAETRKGKAGKIEIEYYSGAELERLLDLIAEIEGI
jgi:ParB family chromosome partitioning protein